MLAYYVHDLSPFLIRFGNGFGIRWYGLAYILAFLFGTLLYRYLAKKGYSDLSPDQVTDFITWSALFGVVIGGRLGYMLFYDLDGFLQNPLIFFRVWEGGMASHGGIIGLALYSLWYAHRHHVSWLNLGDNLVVVAPIGLFLGRCANFINGELFGRATSSLWAMQFPKELLFLPPGFVIATLNDTAAIDPKFCTVEAVIDGVHSSPVLHDYLATILTPRYPSQLLEAFLEGIVLFSLLWILRTRCRLPNGVLTGIFFIAYALLRIAGETFREPDAPLTGFLTRGQFLSLFLILIGLAFVGAAFLRLRYPQGNHSANRPNS
ncbi:MAG: prolipoprotein diacylglyceryl transferase [Verrucomicrobia bacterium RIFCSPHIGHO2_12_FULL_41_10]|nr:MAG: prolipoprotein diacylglyceryl transferase [Verrucomicrobia bacterium RIFCSPHIGHO2_12_FULL_41_10]HLB34120.1 prolipoprotein diacylglyceryl transferase [Chthoniobacterales bacterium]